MNARARSRIRGRNNNFSDQFGASRDLNHTAQTVLSLFKTSFHLLHSFRRTLQLQKCCEAFCRRRNFTFHQNRLEQIMTELDVLGELSCHRVFSFTFLSSGILLLVSSSCQPKNNKFSPHNLFCILSHKAKKKKTPVRTHHPFSKCLILY